MGYSVDAQMPSHLAANALINAVGLRGNVTGYVIHSDRGSHFRSRKFVRVLKRHGLFCSMGRIGVTSDNASMESSFSLLQNNVLDRTHWATRHELRIAIVT